jgi:hypothetical protein
MHSHGWQTLNGGTQENSRTQIQAERIFSFGIHLLLQYGESSSSTVNKYVTRNMHIVWLKHVCHLCLHICIMHLYACVCVCAYVQHMKQ